MDIASRASLSAARAKRVKGATGRRRGSAWPPSPWCCWFRSELDAELTERYPEAGATHFRLDVAEVKRMYVRTAARGRGIGGAILVALETEARVLGVSRLVLETGVRQPEALALYRRFGFDVIPPFGEYVESPLSVCMAKDLG